MRTGAARFRAKRILRVFSIFAMASVAASAACAEPISYTYDELSRVLSVTNSDGSSISYQYDSAGNRTQVVRSTTGPAAPTNHAPTCSNWAINMTSVPTYAGPVSGTLQASAFTYYCADSDGDTLTVTTPTTPLTFTISAHQTLTYPFTVSDGKGGTGSATLVITRP